MVKKSVRNDVITASGVFFLFCIILYSVYYVTPILQNQTVPIYLASLILITGIASFFYAVHLKVKVNRILVCFTFLVLQILIYKAIGHSTCTWNFAFSSCITFLSFFLPPLFINPGSIKLAKIFLFVFIVVVIINVIDNIRLLILYPGASEAINFEYGEEFRSMNIGGTPFVNLIMFTGMFIMLVIQSQKKNHLMLWLLFFLFLIYVLMSGRAISAISFFIGSVLIMLYGNANAKKNRKFLFLVFVLICILVIANIEFISSVLELYLESDRLSSRLQEAASLGRSDVSSGSGLSRLELYWMSIKTFFSSPDNFLFGVGDALSEGVEMYKKGIGMHSAFFDFAAKYGAICLFFYYCLFRIAFLQTYKKLKSINSSSMIIFYMFLVNACINNVVNTPTLILVFVIVPAYLLIINKTDNKHVTKEVTNSRAIQ